VLNEEAIFIYGDTLLQQEKPTQMGRVPTIMVSSNLNPYL